MMHLLGGNEDGKITSSDGIWDLLLLWNDVNADGISTAAEIRPLNQSVLQVLSTRARASKRTDAGRKRVSVLGLGAE